MFLFLQVHCISTAHLPYEPLFLLFLSFLPLSVKELFTVRTRYYCVAVIVILLHFSSSCQVSLPIFNAFFYFFLFLRFFCTVGAQHSSTKGDGTHHSTPPLRPNSRLLKVLFYFFRVFALVFFPNFNTADFTAYRLRKFCNKFNNTRTLVQRSFVFHKVKKLNLKFTARRKSRRKNYRRLNRLACRKRSPGTARTV